MIYSVYEPQDVLRKFAEQGLFNGRHQFGECQCIGFVKDDELCTSLVYHNWDPIHDNIELSGYSVHRRWTTKKVISTLLGYPFLTAGARHLVGRHSEHNHRVRGIWRRWGADEHVLKNFRAEGEGECVAVLSRKAGLAYIERINRGKT